MSGDVGIFWRDQGHLIMAMVPIADGVDDGPFVNGPYDHEPYWTTGPRSQVQRWDVEYHQGPRGRVLFHKAEHRYDVYLDQGFCTNPIKRTILTHFHVPRKHTIFRTDVHDTTDPDELDRLFSE